MRQSGFVRLTIVATAKGGGASCGGPQSGPQLGRHTAVQEVFGRADSNLKTPNLNLAVHAWQARASGVRIPDAPQNLISILALIANERQDFGLWTTIIGRCTTIVSTCWGEPLPN